MRLLNRLRFYRDTAPLKFFGSVGLFFIVIGFLIGLWLIYFFLKTGKAGHMPAAMLTLLLFTVGIQMLNFAFLADMWNCEKIVRQKK